MLSATLHKIQLLYHLLSAVMETRPKCMLLNFKVRPATSGREQPVLRVLTKFNQKITLMCIFTSQNAIFVMQKTISYSSPQTHFPGVLPIASIFIY